MFFESYNFFFIIFLIAVFYFFSNYLKGIYYEASEKKTDQYKILKVSNNHKLFSWVSIIHREEDKVALRDILVLLLTLWRNLKKKDLKFNNLVNISLFFHILSVFLIYKLSINFFDIKLGILISLIYLFSFWPFIIISCGGHHNCGIFFFWLIINYAVFVFQDYETFSAITLIKFFCLGALYCCLNFTSPSASKLNISILAFIIFYSFLINFNKNYDYDLENNLRFIYLWIFVLFIVVLKYILIKFFEKKIFYKFYNTNDTKERLNKKTLDFKKIINFYFIFLFLLIFYHIILTLSFQNIYYQYYIFIFFISYFVTFAFFLLPQPIVNLKKSYVKLTASIWGTHFIGIEDERLLKKTNIFYNYFIFFIKFQKFFFILYFLTFLASLFNANEDLSYIVFLSLLSIPILSILHNHFTKGMVAGFPLSVVFGLFLFSYAYLLDIALSSNKIFINYSVYILIFLYLSLSIISIFNDVLIPRLVHKYIIHFLKKEKIKKLYVLKDLRNQVLIYSIQKLATFDVEFFYVNNFDEIPGGSYLLTPSLNDKGYSYQSNVVGHKKEFVDNLSLAKLKKNILNYNSIIKFKTQDSSAAWQFTGEVITKRYLILKDLNKKDFLLGYIRIIKI